jgi:type IV secretory pathway VirD2 relaxase
LWLGEWIFQDIASSDLPSLFAKSQKIQDVLRRLLISNEILLIMKQPEDDLHIRPGRIRDKRRGAARPKTFVGQVMRAARKAGHTGKGFGRNGQNSGSRFGRGRSAALALSLRTPSRRVVMKARVVRHRGSRFRSAPLAKHVSYLRRDGVTKDGVDARMFDARSDAVEERAFAERSEADRHHFRFTISPEDAAEMTDLRAFTRELMADAERDLGTKLDWIAVDHWNTDNPHVHVLIRGRADDGRDLVISRDYISRGFRARAEERVILELGPRSEQEIQSTLEKEVGAERWTNLDRALRNTADEGAGIANLRPCGPDSDPELRRMMVGRVAVLERLGLAEKVEPGCWSLKPRLEETLRDLGIRGDIIKTMHRVMTGAGRESDVSGFALHGDEPGNPVLGRFVARGLHDELKGSAYAVVEGIDGRTHHLQFADLELTGDSIPGSIVEARVYEDAQGRKKLSLAIRSDLALQQQVTAPGATWLDRQLLAREPVAMGGGFGAEVRDAMDLRIQHLAGEGLVRRQGQRIIFARDLIDTLRKRELSDAAGKIAAETGLVCRPSVEGQTVAGIYRQRVILTSGRFAMIDDGLGFQLVPWRPALEQHLDRHVTGVVLPSGGIDWSFSRKRGLGL